ncbi:MAG: hypothetical protein LBH40_05920, partial [Alphaproteobacteria bacterium]|nr:hypothetical protein [Alphaproteobacteria bacterium]
MLKKLLKFSIKSFLIACLFLTLQACTTAKYRSLVSQRSSLQQTYDKDSKNLEVALEEKKKEVAQIEQTLESLQPATASQFEYFSTIFTKELRSLVSNINSFDSYYYNANNSNIYIVNQDINLSSLKEGNLYYITKNLYINSILDKNSVELELPIKILNA